MADLITFELEYLDRCPICESDQMLPAFKSQWRGQQLICAACHDCGQLFLNPRMTDEQTSIYYGGMYRDITEGAETGGVTQGNLFTQCKRARMQWEMMQRWIGEPKSHLEIGCSAGYFLDEVLALDAIGVEPDARYHRLPIAKKYPMVRDIDEVEPRAFDLISMSHVLEHFNHPLQYLQRLVGEYSHPGTKFLIEVPNTDYQAVVTLSHPMNFGVMTLGRLFEKIGYHPISIQYHGLGQPFPRYLLALYARST
jgi:hypothetical protein